MFRNRTALFCVVALAVALLATDDVLGQRFGQRGRQTNKSSQTSKRLIDLRVQVDPRSPIGTQQDWMKALADVGAEQLKVETSRVVQPSFEEIGSGSRKTLQITAVVNKGKIHLPGGKFSMRQTQAIKDHLAKLRADGGEVTVAKKVAFGLTAKQLIKVHEDFEAVKSQSTKGQPAADVARSLINRSGYKIKISNTADQKLALAKETISAELEGISMGTSLAISLRTMGLVFRPQRKTGQPIELLVDVADANQKNWPTGWPVTETLRQAAPKMYTKIDLQVPPTPILDVLNAIEARAEIPFLYDHAKLKLKKVDLATVKVQYTKSKTTYHSAALAVLRQCKPSLKFDLRIDESGYRFFWISPVN